MAHGQCNCGAVQFELKAVPDDLFVCHCSICRRATGSHGIAVVVVDNSAFRWLCGEDRISTWSKPNADWHCWFCQHCGSILPGENDPAHTFVPAGLLEAESQPRNVTHHIFVDSKAPWDTIGDRGHQHQQAYTNVVPSESPKSTP